MSCSFWLFKNTSQAKATMKPSSWLGSQPEAGPGTALIFRLWALGLCSLHSEIRNKLLEILLYCLLQMSFDLKLGNNFLHVPRLPADGKGFVVCVEIGDWWSANSVTWVWLQVTNCRWPHNWRWLSNIIDSYYNILVYSFTGLSL